jgi:hypothetical protein
VKLLAIFDLTKAGVCQYSSQEGLRVGWLLIYFFEIICTVRVLITSAMVMLLRDFGPYGVVCDYIPVTDIIIILINNFQTYWITFTI